MCIRDSHLYKAGLLFLEEGERDNALKVYELLKQTKSKEQKQDLFEKLYPKGEQKEGELSK